MSVGISSSDVGIFQHLGFLDLVFRDSTRKALQQPIGRAVASDVALPETLPMVE